MTEKIQIGYQPPSVNPEDFPEGYDFEGALDKIQSGWGEEVTRGIEEARICLIAQLKLKLNNDD